MTISTDRQLLTFADFLARYQDYRYEEIKLVRAKF
jgi:hypothetical protein